jgi:hypothetical protein
MESRICGSGLRSGRSSSSQAWVFAGSNSAGHLRRRASLTRLRSCQWLWDISIMRQSAVVHRVGALSSFAVMNTAKG